MKVVVGSRNPAKLEAVRLAFEAVWPEEVWEVVGCEVDSGISRQPMSDEETLAGARTRAQTAMAKLGADFAVGLEGGLTRLGKVWFDRPWAVVLDKDGREGIGSAPSILISPSLMKMVRGGLELGEAVDQIFGEEDTKRRDGYFGLMTRNALTRATAYRDGIIVALIPFLQPQLF